MKELRGEPGSHEGEDQDILAFRHDSIREPNKW